MYQGLFFRCMPLLLIAGLIRGSAAEITTEWIYPGYGDWTNAANWRLHVVPVSGTPDNYHAIINQDPGLDDSVQCSLQGDMSISKLTLGNILYVYGGNTAHPCRFDVRDEFRWLGGALTGSETEYHLYGPAFFESNNTKALGACSLTIHSNAIWTAGNLEWSLYGHVAVETGALFEMRTGGIIGAPGNSSSADFSNRGTTRMDAPGETASFYGQVFQNGVLDVQAGDVQFKYYYQGTGAIHLAEGSRAIFAAGKWEPFPFSGEGEMVFSGEQQILKGIEFPGRTRIQRGLSGTGVTTVHKAVWEGGDIGLPGLIIGPGGSLAVRNLVNLNTSLVNSGTLHLEPSAGATVRYIYSHTNTSDGVIVMSSGSYFSQNYHSAAGSLLNHGTIIKDDGVEGVAELSTAIQNYGSVFCGGGGLNLSSGGTNFGAIEVRAPGSITAKNFSFATNSSLLGDGALSLISCRLAGNVSSNLNLTAAQLDVYGAGLYKFRTLQARSWVRFPSNGGGEILEGLVLNNGLHGGLLRSLKQTELSFPYLSYSAEVKNGSQLELAGRSAWIGGALSVLTNSTVINDSLMEVWDKSQLNLSAGGQFINSGRLTWKAKIKAATATLNDRICTLSATDVWPDISFEDSPWHISGPVVLAPKSIVASPGAELALSGLAVTNASVQLIASSLNLQSNLSSSGAVFHLQNGSVVGPISPWRGSASFSGSGSIRADLQFDSLGLQGVADTNDLVLNGSLLLLGSNAVLRAGATLSDGTPVFPNLSVTGLVTLAGRLEVVPPPRGTLSFHPGPITILESKLPIAGSFANVTNGAILVLTNGFRCRVYAGANSPYGLNRVVLTDFGTVFDQWRMQRFTEQELRDPMVTGQNADPDGNGYSNLAEFALAIDSRKGSADLPRIETGLDGNTYVFVRRAKDVGKLQVNIALSTKLSGWQETTLGSSSFFLSRHRAFEMEDCYQYVYLFIGKPQSMFIRLTTSGSF